MEDFARLPPLGIVDKVIPIRDDVVYRTSGLAIGYTAIHATSSLVTKFLFIEVNDKLPKMRYTTSNGFIAPLIAGNLHESGGFTHG
jgi:hypothetical protein